MATTRFTVYEDQEGPEDPGTPPDVARRDRLLARVYTLEELLARPTEQATPLLGDFLRVGEVTILGGHAGQGKSTMGMDMCHAVATGGEFLGEVCEEPQGVLVVDLEQGIGVAQRAVMRKFYPDGYDEAVPVCELAKGMDFGEHAGNVRWCDWREGAGPDGWDDMFEVIEHLIDTYAPSLVMIDPVYKLMLGRNSSEAEVVGNLVSCIDGIRSRHPDVAWLIPMHPRKGAQGQGPGLRMHDLFGAAMWSWWASSVFLIWRTAGRGVTLRVDKDRLGQMDLRDWELTFTEDHVYKRSVIDVDEEKNSETPIWRLLQEEPGRLFSRKEIIAHTGIKKPTVVKAMKRMERKHNEGVMYREMLIERPSTNVVLYGFMPAPPDPLIDDFKDRFDATEEDDF